MLLKPGAGGAAGTRQQAGAVDLFGIQAGAQALAQQVKAQHRNEDDRAGQHHRPGFGQGGPRGGQHLPQLGGAADPPRDEIGHLDPDIPADVIAQKPQAGCDHQRAADLKSQQHPNHRHDLAQHMLPEHAQRGCAHGAGGFDIQLAANDMGLVAHNAGCLAPTVDREADDESQQAQLGPQHGNPA